MIDWERVRVLRDEVGADAFTEVVALFLEEVEETLEKLSVQTPAAEMQDALHFLKGSASSLGFGTFAGLCRSDKTGALMDAETLETLLGTYTTSKAEFLTGLSDKFGA